MIVCYDVAAIIDDEAGPVTTAVSVFGGSNSGKEWGASTATRGSVNLIE
jgi:hypothetical protein